MADNDKPKKVKVSKTTAKKIRATGNQGLPPGAEGEGLLKRIADALRKKS